MENNEKRAFKIPDKTNVAGVPNDRKKLMISFPVYKASDESHLLESEQNRSILPEAFLTNGLKLLSELCVRALARSFGPVELPPIIADDKLKLRLFYDALSVDLPLHSIVHILDEEYWRRVVLDRQKNVPLALYKQVEWKLRAISDKLCDKLESAAVENWTEEELSVLADQIKEFVIELNIKNLKPLQEESFDRYFKVKDPDLTSSEEEDEEEDIKWKDLVENFVEDVEPSSHESVVSLVSVWTGISVYSDDTELSLSEAEQQSNEQLKIEEIEAEIRESRRVERINLIEKRERQKAEQIKRREDREIRRIEREEREAADAIIAAKLLRLQRKLEREADPPPREKKPPKGSGGDGQKKKGKKKKKKKAVVIEEEEPKLKINYEEVLARRKLYKFPAKDCHHIDLKCLRFFDNLQTLAIEFEGPRSHNANFHPWHFNFSYKDIRNLSDGITALGKLSTFRLRNSRMDAHKFEILFQALQNIDTIEVLDFGYDMIGDESALPFYTYLKNAKALTSLELEGNRFSTDFLIKLAYGLYQYKSRELNYLGLGHNVLSHEGMHELTYVLAQTNHVQKLDMTAAVLDPDIISCCIANQLIRLHPEIVKINLMAIPIDWQSSIDLVTALAANRHIMQLDIRGCGLDSDIEFEIEVLLRRNIFLLDNPYVWDTNITEQELYSYLKTKKNPIFTKAKETAERCIECLKNRPDETEFSVHLTDNDATNCFSIGSKEISEDKVPFVFEPNNFNEEQFFRHLHTPGPGERFFYLQKQQRQKHEIDILDLDS